MGEYTKEQIEEWKRKSEKWDALAVKISKYYQDEDDEDYDDESEGNLCDIGEDAAIAFGYL